MMNIFRKTLMLLGLTLCLISGSYAVNSRAELIEEMKIANQEDIELINVIKNLEVQRDKQLLETHLHAGVTGLSLGAGIFCFKLAQNASGRNVGKAIIHYLSGVFLSAKAITSSMEFIVSADKAEAVFETLEAKREELAQKLAERVLYIEMIK